MADSPTRPKLGTDITDLTPFGGSATEVLRFALAEHDTNSALIDYFVEGTQPDADTVTAINERLKSWVHTLVVEPRLMLAAVLSLPDEAANRTTPFAGAEPPLTLVTTAAIGGADRSRGLMTDPTTIDDLVACGRRWGWDTGDVIAALVDGRKGTMYVSELAGLESFVTNNSAELLAAAQDQPSRAELWRSLRMLSGEQLLPFATDLIDDSASTDKGLRTAARQVALQLPPLAAVRQTQDVIEQCAPANRFHAASTLLASITKAQVPMPSVRRWVEQRIEIESSARVVAVLDKAHSTLAHRETEPVVLPEVRFERVELSDDLWAAIVAAAATRG